MAATELYGFGDRDVFFTEVDNISRQEKLNRIRAIEAEKRREASAQSGVLGTAAIFGGGSGGQGPPGGPFTPSRMTASGGATDSPSTNFFGGGGGSSLFAGDVLGGSSSRSMSQPPPASASASARSTGAYSSIFNDGAPSSAAATMVSSNTNSMAEYLREKDEQRRAPLSETERNLMQRGLTTSFDPTPVKPKKPTLDLTDMRKFVSSPAPRGINVQCRIQRDTTGTAAFYPQYVLMLERRGEDNVFLLAARKRKKSKSSNYLLSLDREDLARDSENYVGKLRSNWIGTEFIVYDGGEAPDKVEGDQPIRRELACVLYESNVLGFKGPRKMTVLSPVITKTGEAAVWQPATDDDSMIKKHKEQDWTNMVCLQNKSPVWNEETSSYVLNFNKRVTQASVKNFQIVHSDDPDYIIMQFGRVGDDEFTMDFQYPLSAIQAFGIALSSFDKKLACE